MAGATRATPAGAPRLRVAVLALGPLSRDTGGRTYLSEVLGPLGADAGLEVDVHYADRAFAVPSTCRAILHRLPARAPALRVLAEMWTARRLRRAAYDVLLAPLNVLPPTWEGPSVVVLHNVLTVTGETQRKLRRPLRALYRRLALAWSLRRADVLVTVSHCLARTLIAVHPAVADRVRPIPLAVATGLAPGVVPKVEERRGSRVAVVSALWGYKRIDQAVAAFAEATREDPEASLVVAGPGTGAARRSLEALAGRFGVEDRVEFVGHLPHARLRDVYATADVLLHLSEREAVGLAALEAMAFGVPVVARDIDAVREFCGNSTLWVSHDADVAEIAEALRMALRSPAVRAALGEAGRWQARRFTWERTAAETADALRQAARGGPAIVGARVRIPEPMQP